ncbi:MAG: DNA-processing protein DprA [Bacteroidota bacterium]
MTNRLLYQIALTQLSNIGNITAKKLVSYCGGVESVFEESKANLLKIPGISRVLVEGILKNNEALKRAEEEIRFIEKYAIETLFYLDNDYPLRLKQCNDSPIMLYAKGHARLNNTKVLSIVGTRNATDYGKHLCQQLIRDLAPMDVLVVSGLAYGIDSAAHKAALDAGLETVAVLGHGLDMIYPAQNRPLAEKIVNQGCLLTEFLSKTKPDRENFPQRNRIVAGMADAVIVIEAGRKGGALITADIATSYNRDVFAIPGRVNDAFSMGCNDLIKANKAALISSAEDVIYSMQWDVQPGKTPKQRSMFIVFSLEEQKIVDLLNENKEMGIDDLCIQSGLKPGKAAEALLNLEFENVVRSHPGNRYSLYG